MTVGFDWEQEDEARRARQEVDPHYIELQEMKKRRARNAILGAVGVLVISGVTILIRQRTYEAHLRFELEQAAINEARALRSGNENRYLLAQQTIPGWQALQAATFEDYQRQAAHLVPHGELLDVVYEDDSGQVVLRETLDGAPYRVTWFYEYTGGEWHHIPAPNAAWGEPTRIDGEHIRVAGYALDQTQISAIQSQMEAWWTQACDLTACGTSGPPPLNVWVRPLPEVRTGWADDDPETILVRSPHIDRVADDGTVEPELMRSLARLEAEYWARWAAPTADDSPADVAWFHHELSLYLAHALGAPENAPLLGPLAQRSGKRAVNLLAGRLQAGKAVIPALTEAIASDPLAEPLGWEVYFETRLRVEAGLIAAGKRDSAAALYGDPEAPAPAALDGLSPDSIRVEGVDRVGEIAWAQVTFTPRDGRDAVPQAAYVPFRVAGDRWVRTAPRPDAFGDTETLLAPHVVLRVPALDMDAAEGLNDALETAYTTAAADLGIAPEEIPGLEVTIVPTAFGDNPWQVDTLSANQPNASSTPLVMAVSSPHLTARPAGKSVQEALRSQVIRAMVIRMVRSRVTNMNPRSPLVMGFVRWELARLGIDTDAFLPNTAPESDVDLRLLQRVWQRSHGGPFVFEDEIAARVLLEQIVSQRGPEAIGPLLAHLAESDSAAEWLKASLDMDLKDIQAQWASQTQVEVTVAK